VIFVVFVAAVFVAGCSPAAPEPRPIVLITVDTLRADHVSAQRSPALDRLAREGLSFDNAVTVSPLTLPSHASLLTANYPPAHGVHDNTIYSLPRESVSYATLLRGRGYATAAFVSAIVLDKRYGLDAGFDAYDGDLGGAPERHASETLGRAQAWIASHADGPFFVWVHLFEPHAPYLAGSYAAEVLAVDRALDGFLGFLRQQPFWQQLVLSVTSDHGESLGEHGEATHGFFVYDATVRIPWILRAPDLAPGRFRPQVRVVDVMPTMTSLAAANVPAPAGVDGVDLSSFVRRDAAPALEAYAETYLPRNQFQWSELRAIRTERMKYIAAPKPELFDLASDPGETRNLLPGRSAEGERFARILQALESRRTQAPRAASDPVVEEKFMALGYIGFSPEARTPRSALPDPKDKVEVYRLAMDALELSERGQPGKALDALARAERLDPDVTQVHYIKGSVLGTEQRYAEAAAALERTIALNPRHVTARFKLALAYIRLQRLDRAESILRTVIADEPRNARAVHNLAAIAYSRGDLAAAEKLEREAIEIDPSYFEAWNTLGAIHIVGKRPGEALDALNRAVRLNPSSGQAQYNLALALRAGGQAAAAAAAAAKACELDRRYCR
jgi:choline-sulfatase